MVPTTPDGGPPPEAKAGLILVVDDDPLNQAVFGAILRKAGFEVEAAYSGQAALDFTASTIPALVLLDGQMPWMNGLAVLRRMRAQGGMTDVPILMVAAASREEDIHAGLDAGADEYLVKPIDPRFLRTRVASALRARRGAAWRAAAVAAPPAGRGGSDRASR